MKQFPIMLQDESEKQIFIKLFRECCGEVLKKYPKIQKKAQEIKQKRGKNLNNLLDFVKYKRNQEFINVGDSCLFEYWDGQQFLLKIAHIHTHFHVPVLSCRIDQVDNYSFGDYNGFTILGSCFVSKKIGNKEIGNVKK